MSYAQGTTVAAEKSRMEIEQTLSRYGADSFGYMTDPITSTIGFKHKGRLIRISVPKPQPKDMKRPRRYQYGWPTDLQKQEWIDQENRRRWRSLLLVIKAKLEAIQSGIATFEDEFLPYTVMPNGQTVAEWAHPQLEEMALGKMPLMLPEGRS